MGFSPPLVSNVYLHWVLDRWFEQEVKPRLKAPAFLVRFADDAQAFFASREDADRFMVVLPKRCAKFGLTIHSGKTRLVNFNRPSLYVSPDVKERPETFDFLGFTYYWSRSRNGKWVVKLKTARDRFQRGLKRINQWCRRNRHKAMRDQHRELSIKLLGHYNYYGVRNNSRSINEFRHQVQAIWKKWLSRRSQKRHLSWASFHNYQRRFPFPNLQLNRLARASCSKAVT